MADPNGFSFQQRGDEVHISHHGRRATVLRGPAAVDFLREIELGSDDQLLMARVTGNYKRGNERTARNHPRHQRGH